MKKHKKIKIALLLLILLFVPAVAMSYGGDDGSASEAIDVPEKAQDLSLVLNVPPLSPWFIETPVAVVGEKSIPLGEFVGAFNADDDSKKTFTRRLEQLIEDKRNSTDSPVEYYVQQDGINQESISIKAPIFSPLFMSTPVAVVNGEPIRFSEFNREIISMYRSMAEGEVISHDYHGLLERLITVELVNLEAENIGIPETESVQTQIDNFSSKALAKLLLQIQSQDVVPNKEEVDEVYRRTSQEVKLLTVQINSEEDASKFREEYEKEHDFEKLAEELSNDGKASLSREDDYVSLEELLPAIKQEISKMDKGGVSQIYKAPSEGYLIFKLMDRRFAENSDLYEKIKNQNLVKERQTRSLEYLGELQEKYALVKKEVEEDLDFIKIKAENPDIDLRDYLAQLKDDQRILVTFVGTNDHKITVSQVAKRIGEAFFHGLEKSVTASKLETEREKALYNMQYKVTTQLEAKKLGLDKDAGYLKEVNDFKRKLLFETFLEKVIAPEVVIAEEEIVDEYNARLDEFSSPAMLKLKSLVFESEKDAQAAYDLLQGGSDFKWVSANSRGLIEKDKEGVLPFERQLLSVTALPEELQKDARSSQSGDFIYFADPDKYIYVLYVEGFYAPQPKKYEDVRSEVGMSLYNKKFQEILDHWVVKLKEVYRTEVYLAQ